MKHRVVQCFIVEMGGRVVATSGSEPQKIVTVIHAGAFLPGGHLADQHQVSGELLAAIRRHLG